uniref:Tensin-2-like n=1 Tax=Poecilia latipinna TaxID=48699 RepID=A0A3B3UPX1_9TELE
QIWYVCANLNISLCFVVFHCRECTALFCLLSQHSSTKSVSQKKKGSLPRKSVEQVMEHVMEGHYDFDLTYITERIISVFFVPDLEEQRYRQNLQEVSSMLKSKHQDNKNIYNKSEHQSSSDAQVHDYAWPDLHAPPLDRICAICKAMETWLTSDPHNVVVLHCKGNKGKTGVIVAAYMHYSKFSAGADQALTTLAMRKFCEDKVSSSLQPSQSRYIYYFSSLLSGSIKMNSSPLFLHQILVPSLPNFQSGGGFYPFLKIYQSLQLAYTSGVKCYHRRSRAAEREVVFRVQFHTCTVHGAQLWFGKTELDLACTDDRFPPDATVEFIFANSPEKLKGREYRKNDSSVKVDYKTSDPVVRWDSYENLNLHHEDSTENIAHTRGPLDGSLYAQVRKRRGPGATSSAASPNGCLTSSPTVKPQTQSASRPQPFAFNCSPRGSAVSSDRLSETSLSIDCSEREDPDCPLRKEDVEDKAKEKRRQRERDRETAILDDGDPSSPGVMRQEHSCCGQAAARCSDAGWEKDRDLCLPGGRFVGHCNSIKKHPKSQTLPALPSKSMSPPPHSAIMELCHRHSAHPVTELTWERPIHPPSLPCLNRSCYPYLTPEHALTHSHTLPASNRCYLGEECHLLHYPDHGSGPHPSLQPQPGNPYREVSVSSPKSSSYCHCQDCSSRREHPSSSANMFQQLHSDQAENTHWPKGAGVQRSREAPLLWETEKSWELTGKAELWQCKSPLPAFHLYHPTLEQVSNLEQPRFAIAQDQNYPIPQSLMDVRDGASSGYHTPLQPRHSCPCAPYQSSPSESRESRGYASGYHSGSASPMPANSPSPGRGRLPDIPLGSRDSANDKAGRRLIPDQDISADTKPPSPVPDGYHTPTFPLASYYYSLLNPPLPEKKRFSSTAVSPNGHIALLHTSSCPSPVHHVTFSPAAGDQRRESAQHSYAEEAETRVNSKFVQDSSKYWYKPGISRDQAIAVLKDKEPGAFLIRDSNSFQGAYGLALKVATPPPNANVTGNKGDPVEQLVRHFLIETGPRGVKIKGCQNESYFGSLSALVYQHSITPISLPCALRIPDKDLVGELQEMQSATNTSTAADLLKQGAACNVLYLNSVETESLTGPEAVSKAIKCTKALSPRPVPTVVHFKVSSQGITLTDSKRRVFFRRHYPISSVTFSSLDPQNQRFEQANTHCHCIFPLEGFLCLRLSHRINNLDNYIYGNYSYTPSSPQGLITKFVLVTL